MRAFIKTWPFGQLSEKQIVRFSDGTDYMVERNGWRKIRLSDRHRRQAQRNA